MVRYHLLYELGMYYSTDWPFAPRICFSCLPQTFSISISVSSSKLLLQKPFLTKLKKVLRSCWNRGDGCRICGEFNNLGRLDRVLRFSLSCAIQFEEIRVFVLEESDVTELIQCVVNCTRESRTLQKTWDLTSLMESGCNSSYLEKTKPSISFSIVILCKNAESMSDMDIVDPTAMHTIINEKRKSTHIFLNRDDSLTVTTNFICEGLWTRLPSRLTLASTTWSHKSIGTIICSSMVQSSKCARNSGQCAN